MDLGRELAPHELVARAFDSAGRELARARQWLNVPRPPAEASLLLERNSEGRAVAARLMWQSLLGTPPSRVEVSFDGRPLDVRDPARIRLPEFASDAIHLISAEVEFSPAVVTRAGIVLGADSENEASSELTGVPVRVSSGATLPPAASAQGWFRKGSEPLHVVAVEKGPALVLVVRDTDHTEALTKLGNGGRTIFVRGEGGALSHYDPDATRFETRLGETDRIRFLWPRANRAPGSEMPTELFDVSRDFFGGFAGIHWLLTHVSHPIPRAAGERFADAVAIAGLQASAAYTRRAVILVLGQQTDDASRYSPGLVRSYLAKIHVPLFVWSVETRTADRVTAAWGESQDVSTYPKLKVAFERLRRELDSQQLVWLEGRHMPQEIALSTEARGIEIVH